MAAPGVGLRSGLVRVEVDVGHLEQRLGVVGVGLQRVDRVERRQLVGREQRLELGGHASRVTAALLRVHRDEDDADEHRERDREDRDRHAVALERPDDVALGEAALDSVAVALDRDAERLGLEQHVEVVGDERDVAVGRRARAVHLQRRDEDAVVGVARGDAVGQVLRVAVERA